VQVVAFGDRSNRSGGSATALHGRMEWRIQEGTSTPEPYKRSFGRRAIEGSLNGEQDQDRVFHGDKIKFTVRRNSGGQVPSTTAISAEASAEFLNSPVATASWYRSEGVIRTSSGPLAV
jgi:hypothetical protein